MNFLYEIWDDLISLLFPRVCYGCGNHLTRNENIICTECYVRIPRTGYHIVPDNPVARLFWGRCNLQKAAAFSFYNRGSRIRSLIHNLKYKNISEIGSELGRIYGTSLKSSGFMDEIDLIIPVPLHPEKKRSRGYNQSELISQGIAEITGIPIDTESLVRIRPSQTQTRKSRFDRWTNVEGIFRIIKEDSITGKHVLIVDDVITTGSTVESCANALLGVEGVKVSAVAMAYAVI